MSSGAITNRPPTKIANAIIQAQLRKDPTPVIVLLLHICNASLLCHQAQCIMINIPCVFVLRAFEEILRIRHHTVNKISDATSAFVEL